MIDLYISNITNLQTTNFKSVCTLKLILPVAKDPCIEAINTPINNWKNPQDPISF